jgi:1-acyl-sn-glycerol-3-phosphate acyltransferase
MSEHPLINRLWYQFVKRIVQLATVLVYHVRYSGWHNIPTEGGALVVSNHQSHLDPPLVGIGCPRQMYYMARDTLFRFAPFGWFIRSIGAFPIDREKGGLSGIKEALKKLKHGEMVVMFPEGTRTHDGEIAPFRPGFTTLAVRSKAAILPVAIEGAYEAYPRWRKFPGRGRIRVHYGKPILPSEYADYDEQALLAEVERRVRECQAKLRRQTLA